jgi:hypothetical protein
MNHAANRDEDLFAEVLARPAHESAAFLDGACNGDVPLRERIIALIASHAGPDSLIAPPVANLSVVASAKLEEKAGDAIGHFKLLQKSVKAAAASCGWGAGGAGATPSGTQGDKVINFGKDTRSPGSPTQVPSTNSTGPMSVSSGGFGATSPARHAGFSESRQLVE